MINMQKEMETRDNEIKKEKTKKKKQGLGVFKQKKECKHCIYKTAKMDEMQTINEILVELVEKHSR